MLLALLVACGGGGDPSSPVTPTPSGGFSLGAGGTTPAAIPQAGSGTATVTVARTGAFTGSVAIAIEGAPSGVTITPSSSTIASGTSSAALTIDVSLNVPTGSYPLTIRGTASGQTQQTTTLTLVVVTRPASVTLTRNSAGAVTVNAGGQSLVFGIVLTRIEFVGAVTMDLVTPLANGITLSFAPNPTTGNSMQATLTASASAAPGTYTAELRGSGAGISPTTLSVAFTVLGPATLNVTVSRTTVSMPQNGSGLTSIGLQRTNFTSAVTLTVSGLPTGVAGTFENNPTASTSTTLNFTASGVAAPGTYALTITGTAPGVPTAAVAMTVIITPTGTGGNTSIRFCGAASDIPIWLGYAVSNSWVRVAIGANNTFSFDFGTQGSIAWVTQKGPDDFRISVTSALRDEMAGLLASQCPSPSDRTATGSVSGVDAADQVQVALGPRVPALPPTFASPNFTIVGLPEGALDLLATRATFDAGALVVNRVIVQRGLTPPNGGSVGQLNFGAGSTLLTEGKSLTVQGVSGGEQLAVSSSLRTGGGTSISLGAAVITGASGTFRHVNVGQLLAGDLHTVQASATLTSGAYSISRTASQTVASPIATTLALGAVPPEPNVFVFANSADQARYISFIPFLPDYTRLYTTGWLQQSGATRREVIMTVTEAMAAITTGSLGTNARILAPDFSAASGFNTLWESRPGLAANYFVTASGWTASGGVSAPLADGVLTKSWSRFGPVP